MILTSLTLHSNFSFRLPDLLVRSSIYSECSVSFSLVFLYWHSMASSIRWREWKSTLVLFGKRQQYFLLQILQLVAWVCTRRGNSCSQSDDLALLRFYQWEYALKTNLICKKWSLNKELARVSQKLYASKSSAIFLLKRPTSFVLIFDFCLRRAYVVSSFVMAFISEVVSGSYPLFIHLFIYWSL